MSDMKFRGKNRVENVSTLTVSTGDSTKQYIYDRVFSVQWSSVGSDDTTEETLEVVWASAQTFDCINLLNHNCKEFDIQYWNGAAYVDFSTAINETANTATDNSYSFTEVTSLKVKIKARKTIVVDEQKKIGQFMIYKEYVSIPEDFWPDIHSPISYFKKSEHEKADGGNLIIVQSKYSKHRNNLFFNELPEQYVDDFSDLKLLFTSIWFMPDDSDLQAQYYVNWINDFNFKKVAAWVPSTLERCYEGSVEMKGV